MQVNRIWKTKTLVLNIIGIIFLSTSVNTQAQQVFKEKESTINSSYLESKDTFKDYILDTGDTLKIEFENASEISSLYTIDPQGEIFFKRLKFIYVRGLTINELTKLLNERYEEFLVDPNIYIRIDTFKPIRVAIRGEVRSPKLLKFPAYSSTDIQPLMSNFNTKKVLPGSENNQIRGSVNLNSLELSENRNSFNLSDNTIKNETDNITTLTNAIQEAGGLTSYSDISRIEIVRDIPIGKGGGKKRTFINLKSYIYKNDNSNDIRLYDGDSIFIPKLQEKDSNILANSILAGITPKFINVSIRGRVETPGRLILPKQGSLSDAMNLSGPRKPLSGKIFLVRYNKDGSLTRKNIKYSATATPGSPKNPYLFSGDLITVKDSMIGRSSGVIKAITEPFVGLYTSKELLNIFQ